MEANAWICMTVCCPAAPQLSKTHVNKMIPWNSKNKCTVSLSLTSLQLLWFPMLIRCLLLLCAVTPSFAIILRIRGIGGNISRLKFSNNDTVSIVARSIMDLSSCSDDTAIVFASHGKARFVDMLKNQTRLLDTFIVDGELITVEVPGEKALNPKLRKQNLPLRRSHLRSVVSGDTMVKLSRQVPNKNRIVMVAPSALQSGDTAKRQGSVAILIGSLIKPTNTVSKQQRKRGLNESSADSSRACWRVVASVDVCTTDCAMFPQDLQQVNEMARGMNLSVLGIYCGVDSSGWEAEHVYSLVKVSEALQGAALNELIALSAVPVANGDPAGQVVDGESKLQLRDASMSIEAHCLSDQAAQLATQGILVSTRLPSRFGSARVSSSRGRRRGSSDAMSSAADIRPEDRVVLAGEVLIDSREEREVDASVLAVPLSISLLKCDLGRNAGGASAVSGAGFAKVFPSPAVMRSQLAEDKLTQIAAKKYLVALLDRAVSGGSARTSRTPAVGPEELARLRDTHLLMYLQSLMDGADFHRMCAALSPTAADVSAGNDGRCVLPKSVLAALSHISLSLKSSQRGGEEEEDDDEL